MPQNSPSLAQPNFCCCRGTLLEFTTSRGNLCFAAAGLLAAMSSPSKLMNWLTSKVTAKVKEVLDSAGPKDDEVIDESMPVVQRLTRYSESPVVAHRVAICRDLVELGKEAGVEISVEKIVPMIERLVRDAEPSVRGQLVESMPMFCAFLKDNLNLDGYTTNVLHILLPLVAELTTDDNPQTRAGAVTALVVLARTIRHEDLVPYLIPIIRSLAKDRTEEEHRVQAAILLHSLADVLGRSVCVEHVLPRVEQLAIDPQFRVRKAVAQHLGLLMSVIKSEENAAPGDSMLAVFVELSKDGIWGVRKACCDSLVAVSASATPEQRSALLVPMFERLADDESRWVRGAAFQNLGPFIATFSDGRVDPKLLMFYRTMPHPSKHGRDADIALFCAHAFPGVLQTVGGGRWAELSDLYLLLVKDLQWKVRETLAHSLHEVARLVGQQVAERTLLTVFEAFVQDLDEVKSGVVAHLAAFLAVLSPGVRAQYAPVVAELRQESAWRVREAVAAQMAVFATLFAPRELREVVAPACAALCRDAVQTVRAAAFTGLAALFVRADLLDEVEEPALRTFLEAELRRLQEGTFHDRALLARVCGAYLSSSPVSSSSGRRAEMLGLLDGLARDRTPNVRLAAATALAGLEAGERVQVSVWPLLVSDPDYDVRYAATGVFVPFSERKAARTAKLASAPIATAVNGETKGVGA